MSHGSGGSPPLSAFPPGVNPIDVIPVPATPEAVRTAHALEGITLTLEIIATFLVISRIYCRVRPVIRLKLDDYLIMFAWVSRCKKILM